MMNSNLNQLFNSPDVIATIQDVEARELERGVGVDVGLPREGTVDMLHVAAVTSLVEVLGDNRVDIWFRPSSEKETEMRNLARLSFLRWRGYLRTIYEAGERPVMDDLLMFAVSGLIANRDHEVREALRRPLFREWLDSLVSQIDRFDWLNQVRVNISASILHIIRQEDHGDILNGNRILEKLAETQKHKEASWIAERPTQERDAGALLGFYHLAEAVILTARFLTNGSVMINGREVTDFAAELRRLLVRAEEFMQFSGDLESLLWLQTAAGGIAHLRASSIWVQAKGISPRIDRLITELTREHRDQPVFSLLPSQQRALRESLLDPSRVAIVLQMPTSAGKTMLAEFSIIQTFDSFREAARVVYLVPTRALATQIRRTLTEDLRPLGIEVAAAGSAFEEDPYELQLLNDSDGVIVATPEKLDLLLRSHSDWFRTLRLVVVDEAHLIQDNERGARLELLLANLRREHPDARLLLLTPFMENAEEIAQWLSRDRPSAISVQWRPTRVLLGMAKVSGTGPNRSLTVDWKDPYDPANAPRSTRIPTRKKSKELTSNLDRVLFLADQFRNLGTSLAMFSASPADAEEAATRQAEQRDPIQCTELSPQLRVAIAISRHEFGKNSKLAYCLERGIAFHHSSLPPIIRYLIEDQIRAKNLSFVAATSTLAQGMNFPVASILVHSVHKPYGTGNLTPAEFWNMAGRAGRVGLSEKGLVLFADPNHQSHLERYSEALSESLHSAMLSVLDKLNPTGDLKEQYRQHPTIRPFIQYLAHAAASSSATEAIRNLEALVEQSLVNQQVPSVADSRKLRSVARSYLQQLVNTSSQMIKAADSTGLGTFSFNELYAKLRNDPILSSGPRAVMNHGEHGLEALVEALRWLPELDLAIGFGSGQMNVRAVAKAVQSWIDGAPVYEIAEEFPGDTEAKRIREASRYLNSTVSQTLSWGAHAFIRGWSATGAGAGSLAPEDAILPSKIQYGVTTPEAVVASFLGVPRSVAEATAEVYRDRHGTITPETTGNLRTFVEQAGVREWDAIVQRSNVPGLSGQDLHLVYRQMQGLPTE